MAGLTKKEKAEGGKYTGGLQIVLGGQAGGGDLAAQVQALQNQIGAQADYTQPLNPLTTVFAQYTTATAQVFTTGAAAVVNYDTKVRDTHNAVTTGAAWTFTAPLTGPYMVAAYATFADSTAWGVGEGGGLRLYVNGVWERSLDRFIGPDTAAVSKSVGLRGCSPVWLTAGQALQIYAIQNTGGNLALSGTDVTNWISITYAG